MKRIVTTILLIVYLATSSGATISFHYCMDKYIGWDLSLPISNKCSNCGMKKENQKGCCHDEQKILDVKKDQLAYQINDMPDNNFKYLHAAYFSIEENIISVRTDKDYIAHSPPGSITSQLFILNRVFRI